MSIVTGVYIIVNVGQSAPACLADDNDGTPVIVNPEQGDTQERVRVSISITNHLVVPTILNPNFPVDREQTKQWQLHHQERRQQPVRRSRQSESCP